ncbi:MAG: hypothetical protein FWE04_00535 [Oscillospiraceae bacterium]|nr:hypothetical protein [Oscillospiraceae bacterium]
MAHKAFENLHKNKSLTDAFARAIYYDVIDYISEHPEEIEDIGNDGTQNDITVAS